MKMKYLVSREFEFACHPSIKIGPFLAAEGGNLYLPDKTAAFGIPVALTKRLPRRSKTLRVRTDNYKILLADEDVQLSVTHPSKGGIGSRHERKL